MNGVVATPSSTEPPAEPSLVTTETGEPNPNPTDPPAGDPPPVDPNAAPKADDPPADPPAPLTAEDITFPEGFQVQDEIRDEFLGVVNNADLSPKERTQALIDLYAKTAQAASEASSQAWTDMQKTWQDEVRADSDVGGNNLQPALGRIGKLIDEYGSPELVQVFNLTGAGNNVHMVKFLNTLATHLTEGGPVQGQPSAQQASAAQRMFPSMKG